MSERVFIIGPGHVGRGLSRAFRASGVEVVGLHGKRPSGVASSTGALPKELGSANVIIVAVRDPQLDETIDETGVLFRAFADRAMDVVNIKISKFGGLTGARQIRDICVAMGIAMTIEDSGGSEPATEPGRSRAPRRLNSSL